MQASVGREKSELSQTLGKRMWSLYAFRPLGCKKNVVQILKMIWTLMEMTDH